VSAPRARLPRSAYAASAAAAGAWAASLGMEPIALAVAGLVLCVVAMSVSPRAAGPRWAGPRASVATAGVGLLLLAGRLLIGPAGPAAAALPDGTGPWLAGVESVGSPRDGSQVARLALDTASGPVIVAATLPSFPIVQAGAVVEVGGRLQAPPDDDPYGEYLRRTGAAGSLRAARLRVVRSPSVASLQSLRDGAGDALRVALPEPEAGLAAGILIGLRERVDRGLAADFATAGASHVVAISGWNIAIVAGLVGVLLRGRPRRLVAVAVAGTIAAYVVAAGASPSVVRAAVMAAVVLAARESGRAGRAPAALALAALIMLLVDPAMISDAGFRLSVMATAGLLAWGTPLGHRISHLWGGRVPRWLAESLGISLAAQAATLPDVLLTFGRLSIVAPGVNLLVVPLVPGAMAAGVVAMLGGALSMLGAPGAIAVLAGLPAWLGLHLMVAVVRVAAGLPFAAIAIPPEVAPVVALAAAVALLLVPVLDRRIRATLVGRGRRRARAHPTPAVAVARSRGAMQTRGRSRRRWERPLLIGCLVVVALSTLALGQTATLEARLVMLDVGQGDAILLEGGDGSRMLVDGGPDPDRLLVELGDRIPPWDRRIDVIVLTHPHEDHVAGLVRVLDRYRVGRVFEPGMRGPGPAWEAWDEALHARPAIARGTLAAGARIRIGEIVLRAVWPDPGTVPSAPGSTGRAINDTSIILLGEANGRRFLLTGDAEDDVDPSLVAHHLPHLDVLKVAHHGSATATSAALLAETRPRVALISVGAGNDYGHPAPSTLDRLRNAGARVLRTDQSGTIEVDLRPGGLAVRFEGRARTGSVRLPQSPGTGYDSGHDRHGAPRGRPPAALTGTARMVPQPRLRRRGRRRLDRGPREGTRRDGGCGRGRGCRAPP
jgi:competence protein ComEC